MNPGLCSAREWKFVIKGSLANTSKDFHVISIDSHPCFRTFVRPSYQRFNEGARYFAYNLKSKARQGNRHIIKVSLVMKGFVSSEAVSFTNSANLQLHGILQFADSKVCLHDGAPLARFENMWSSGVVFLD